MSAKNSIDLEKGLLGGPEKTVKSIKGKNKRCVVAGVFSLCTVILLVVAVIVCSANEAAGATGTDWVLYGLGAVWLVSASMRGYEVYLMCRTYDPLGFAAENEDDMGSNFETNMRLVMDSCQDFTIEEDMAVHEVHEDQCAICLDKWEVRDHVCLTRCRHIFHKECLENCVKIAVTCPLCRSPLIAPLENGSS